MARTPYVIDGIEVPSVTTILKSINKPALLNWASYGARDATRRVARSIYETAHPGGLCLGLDAASFAAAVEKAQGRRPAHLDRGEVAMEIGTLVHARIEAEMRRELGQDVPLIEIPTDEIVDGRKVPHPARTAYEAYCAWRKANEVRPVALELRVYSRQFMFAGTTDFVGRVADVLTVADWKTSKAVYAEYRIQIAAYRHALVEMQDELKTAVVGGLVLRFPKEAADGFEAHDVPVSEQDELMADFLAAKHLYERGLGR